MKYQLNPASPWAYDGSPANNEDGTTTQPIIINPQIIGDTYGFISPSPSKNQTRVVIPAKIENDQVKAYIQTQATAFCAQQYPDTK